MATGVTVRATVNEYQETTPETESFHQAQHRSGVGPVAHDYGGDRPPETYGGDVTVHTGPDHPSHVRLPVIPDRE